MGPKAHDFLVTLRRNSPQTPWGIRLVGGTDLNAPLIITRVQVNSPAQKELLRGDIITKIDQYDARDLTHNDAQNLFRDASNQIKVTIRRDDTVALYQSAHEKNDVGSAGYSPALSPIPPAHSAQPYKPYGQPAPAQPFQQQPQQPKAQPHLNFPPPEPSQLLPSVNSSLPHGPQAYAAALEHPVETLPHTAFPKLDASGAYQLPKTPYPPPMVPNFDEANEAITNQIVHKQFNSPIGLYSDSNIENTIRQTAPQTQAVPSNGFTSRHRPTKIEGYKKTVVFDPSKSETYRALQEGAGEGLQEVTTPIQPRTFQPNRLVPGKKPNANHPAPQPEFAQHVNSMGEPNEKIQQSGSFRRLMHHVLAETDY
ncbi:PDZ and LIM domain protein 3 isoform X6 [Toxorhynchites rutilus septentrionalis]|uniref:PDZ and LIM domain protein 3 isoform X6 n=1 Tax=Toxorhynchites rutilus septentrionalis TaxID=329112 RepID=UPI0024793C17|nr:PDZ and LIM domain protein 3 isoform X6 [Toxorhynchites rutilus septentrionalis]